MKKGVIIALFILPGIVVGQNPLLVAYAATSVVQPSSSDVKKIDYVIRDLELRRGQLSEQAFLYKVFKNTQRKFLKTYSTYPDFAQVFTEGRYDCLTATALYSIVLTSLDFKFDIVETNYHIFLMVHTQQGDVLLETTDRLAGYVADKKEIEKRIGSYLQNKITSSVSDKFQYQYSFNLFHNVEPQKLAGLLYFNQAVKEFNRHDLLECATLLDKAKEIYESPRIAEFALVLVQSVMESNLETDVKYSVLQRYKKYITAKGNSLASR